MNKTLFVIGLFLVCLAAALLLMNMLPFGVAAAIAVLGIGLVTVAGRSGRAQQKSKPEAQVVKIIYSPDRQLRAAIKQRVDGKYQIELWKLVSTYSQDFGPGDQWAIQSDLTITDTLSNAMDIAESRVRAGEG